MMKIIERRKRERSCFYIIQPGMRAVMQGEFMSLRYDFLGEIKKTACMIFSGQTIDVHRDLLAKMLKEARNESK